MGINLGDLTIKHNFSLSNLSGKTISIDAFNTIYQFLASIRQPDGTPLMDFKGNITSHLTGLFYRTSRFIENGIKPVYVFDGKPSDMKGKTIEKRIKNKKDAEKKWRKAIDKGKYIEAKKYAQATSRLTSDMVAECKELLDGMGIPWIQAISEGEAQSAVMAQRKIVYASASQDYDSLLFGAPILLRNLSIIGRRKVPRKDKYIIVEPEKIMLEEILKKEEITREKLVWIGILCGTDFNNGVKGIGPKTALKLVKKYNSFDKLNDYVCKKYNYEFEIEPEKVISLFMNPPYVDVKKIIFKKPNINSINSLLCERHDFSEDRVEKTVKNFQIKSEEIFGQSKLDKWF